MAEEWWGQLSFAHILEAGLPTPHHQGQLYCTAYARYRAALLSATNSEGTNSPEHCSQWGEKTLLHSPWTST